MEEFEKFQENSQALVAEELPQMNPFQKLFNVIFSPVKAAEGVIAKPGVLFPILMILILPVLLVVLRFPVYQQTQIELTRTILEANPQLTPEQIDATIKMTTSNALLTVGGMPVSSLLAWFFMALLAFIFVKIFKGEGSFKHYLSWAGYAFVFNILASLLIFIASYFTGSYTLNTSLALFTPDLRGSVLYGILRGMDLFSIWYYIVFGIGLARISKLGKVKIGIFLFVVFSVTIAMGIGSLKYI